MIFIFPIQCKSPIDRNKWIDSKNDVIESDTINKT